MSVPDAETERRKVFIGLCRSSDDSINMSRLKEEKSLLAFVLLEFCRSNRRHKPLIHKGTSFWIAANVGVRGLNKHE